MTILNPLRAFYEAAQCGSIRKASDKLRMAPSSVSRQIVVLEQQMGTALFDRTGGGVKLTHAGTLVADYARSVILDYDSLRRDLDDRHGTRRHMVKVALVESVMSSGPVQAIAAFRADFESVTFVLDMMPAPQISDTVKSGTHDLGVAFCPEPDPDILGMGTIAEPIVLAVRPEHPLVAAGLVRLSDLHGIPLALPRQDFGVRQIVDRAAKSEDVLLDPVLQSNSFEALRNFARSGMGAAILPKRAVVRLGESNPLYSLTIRCPALEETAIHVVVLRKRRLPRIVRLFAERLVRHMS